MAEAKFIRPQNFDDFKGPLGFKYGEDRSHVEKYPISTLLKAGIPKTPISIGINWYSDFDEPVQIKTSDGVLRWVIAPKGIKGYIRGGHCVCIRSENHTDSISNYNFYDQGNEGACVGFGTSRMMNLMNGKKYDARWLWDQAKIIDEWDETNPGDDEGTSVHAGFRVLNNLGHVPWSTEVARTSTNWRTRDTETPVASEGVSAYRWATSLKDIRTVLQSQLNDRIKAVPFLNSWGPYYPHVTWMPYSVLEQLMNENGEFGLPTDR